MSIFQSMNKKYSNAIEWVKENSYGIESLSDCEMDHLRFLEQVLKDKRIVWLGENGHGIAEHSSLKTKLINFLYQRMGFKVIAFESGLSECYSSNYIKDKLTVNELMAKSVFSLWKTEETLPLFQQIKENDDLMLIGFDFQPSSKESLLLDFLESIDIDFTFEFKKNINKIDEMIIDWYRHIGKYKAVRKKVPKDISISFQRDKQVLFDMITQTNIELETWKEEFLRKDLYVPYIVVQKILDNKRKFIDKLDAKHREYLKFRDQIMAENLEWICNKLYPNEKIIIWANNTHIYKNIQSLFSHKPMGSLMSPDLINQSYYLGLFMYEGNAALNNGNVYKLRKPPKKSLEDYMNHNQSQVSFLDFASITSNESNKWIFNNTVIMESGTMEQLITPVEQLDGVFFIKKVSPPRYI
ncbi:erythromycin esterase family protein [Psychrobacillus sp. INOP01]|uniref:erythromycin esterase family protein n=1 Tax=Psychrobacillus sp. INOP01 TaxID=2829187 RepID=UPI001BA51ACE|nr:erythromycin esterase family protein [Psychrobacillus sp. INOP01]QUG42892.1 erythromycin esterase family protein [Psychrobacillus sp. INOP01]